MSRLQSHFFYMTCVFALAAFGGSCAHAQGGRCSNNAINQAYNSALHRAPNGSGATGECNPVFYGGGSWTSPQDLVKRVGAAVYCSNNYWIGQIYYYEYNRSPTNAECSANYGYNSSMSYMQLDAAIKSYVARSTVLAPSSAGRPTGSIPQPLIVQQAQSNQLPALAQWHVDAQGNLVSPRGQLMAYYGHYTINAGIVAGGGGNIVSGGKIVAGGGGNIMPQPGMVVNTNGSNFWNAY